MAWDSVTLVEDADLTQVESRMPGLAQTPTSDGNLPYDGKRDLAKSIIGTYLKRRGIEDLERINNPLDFKLAAVYLELHLIYMDMSATNPEAYGPRVSLYNDKYKDEIGVISIDLSDDEIEDRSFRIVDLKRA